MGKQIVRRALVSLTQREIRTDGKDGKERGVVLLGCKTLGAILPTGIGMVRQRMCCLV